MVSTWLCERETWVTDRTRIHDFVKYKEKKGPDLHLFGLYKVSWNYLRFECKRKKTGCSLGAFGLYDNLTFFTFFPTFTNIKWQVTLLFPDSLLSCHESASRRTLPSPINVGLLMWLALASGTWGNVTESEFRAEDLRGILSFDSPFPHCCHHPRKGLPQGVYVE